MKVEQFAININTEQPDVMIAFYEDIVGLRQNRSIAPGAFMAGSSTFMAFIIEGHSEISGATKEPQRVLLNFVITDLAAEQKRLKSRGVTFVRTSAEEPGVGIFSTFLDPDGNFCQLVELSG